MSIRVAAVSYLNTIPLLEGLNMTGLDKELDLVLAPPSECARLLIENEVDISLCPVAVLTQFPRYKLVSDYCIGCTGAVRTVTLFSNTPLADIFRIYLDPESRTSNILVKILCSGIWNIHPDYSRSIPVPSLLPGEAKLGIGDKCFKFENQYDFKYDLGKAWVDYTGLPFVFACWLSPNELPGDLEMEMNKAFQIGISKIPEMQSLKKIQFPGVDNLQYLTENISFDFNPEKKSGLVKYLALSKTLNQTMTHVVKNSS